MKRITRNERLTPEEAAKYRQVREQVDAELPELVARHHERTASLDQLDDLCVQLKAAREAKGLSLADLSKLTGMDRSAISKLETGVRMNPTVETLVRYAEAVGKQIAVSLADSASSLNSNNELTLHDQADQQFEQLLKHVITESHLSVKADQVALALLFFLTRVSNTWLSIRTLHRNSPHESVYAVDAGALLRAMFDAYLQAEYVVSDVTKSVERANDYFDHEHVERYKRMTTMLKYDNWLTKRLKSSPLAAESEKNAKQEYERVKARFLMPNKKRPGSNGTRNHWYPGNLSEIARDLNKLDEYEILLATFHGCVHSSSQALRAGPPMSSKHAIDWASTIAARVADLNVEHNRVALDEFHARLLAEWNKPYFNIARS